MKARKGFTRRIGVLIPVARLQDRQQSAAEEFIATVARMLTEDEMEGGMVSEDAISTLNDLIAEARKLTASRSTRS